VDGVLALQALSSKGMRRSGCMWARTAASSNLVHACCSAQPGCFRRQYNLLATCPRTAEVHRRLRACVRGGRGGATGARVHAAAWVQCRLAQKACNSVGAVQAGSEKRWSGGTPVV
jgi:hypothetical protein